MAHSRQRPHGDAGNAMSRVHHWQRFVPLSRPRACVRRSPSLRPARVPNIVSVALTMNRPCLSVSFPPCLPTTLMGVRIRLRHGGAVSLSPSLPPIPPLSFSRSVCIFQPNFSLSLVRAHSLARTVRPRSCVRAAARLRLRFVRVPSPSLSVFHGTRSRVSPVYVLLSVRLARFRARTGRPRRTRARDLPRFCRARRRLGSPPVAPLAPTDRGRAPRRAPPLDQHPPSVPAHPSPFLCPTSSRPVLLSPLSLSFALVRSRSRWYPATPRRRGWSGTFALSLARSPARVAGSLALCPSSGTHPPQAASSSAR